MCSPCMNQPGHSVIPYKRASIRNDPIPDHPFTYATEAFVLTSLVNLERMQEASTLVRWITQQKP